MNTLKILQQLIQIPSVSGQEQNIQEWIYQFIVSNGLKPEWVGPNVVVKIPGKESTKALIFNGHVDTVTPGEENSWQYSPFAPEIVDGKVYGLGSTDMKSGIAVMLKLIEKHSLIGPKYDLWFHFVVKEEVDGSGTEQVMRWFGKYHQRKYQELSAIIPEPTNLKVIEIAHKGNIFLKVTVKGDGGHGSTPEKIKLHAITKMHKVAKELNALVKSWQKEYRDEVLGVPTLAWTSIQAGDLESPNKIGDTAVATFDLRTTPLVHEKALVLLQKLQSKNISIEAVYLPLPCGYTSPDAKIVRLTQQLIGLPLGKTPGSTDLLFFTKAGIPGIILGPGEKEKEHMTDEYVYMSKLEKSLEMFQAIIGNF